MSLSNREIKFRAWLFNKMIKPMSIQKMVHQRKSNIPLRILEKECVFMQFTGLQDKNLEDIYEGDIIYHDDFNEPCKVTFERGCFRFYGFTIANFEAIHHLDTKVQVIGNIYENPELLKG